MKNSAYRSIITLIVLLALIFSFSSCTVNGVVNNAVSESEKSEEKQENRPPHIEVRPEVSSRPSHSSPKEDPKDDAEDNESESKETINPTDHMTEGAADDIFNDLADDPIADSEHEETEEIVKDAHADMSVSTTSWSPKASEQDVFTLATECIAYDLYEAGYVVFRAFAIAGEKKVYGIAFTEYEIYDDSTERTIYNCGFIQLTEDGIEEKTCITPEDAENGVVIVPYGEYDTTIGFILTLGSTINSYSAIYDDYFFRYDQISSYRVKIKVCGNKRSVWDESIDLYSFTDKRYIFKGDMTFNSVSASPYFSDEHKAYEAAKQAVNEIIKVQDKNGNRVEKQIIIVFSEEAINEYLVGKQQGAINDFLLSQIEALEVKENEIVVVTTEGVSIETIVDREAISQQRFTNGLISFFANALLVAGALTVAVATGGAGTPFAITAIGAITGVGAMIYGVSNIIEAGQEIYHGVTGNITTESKNPVLDAFKKAIGDEDKAVAVYHTWGLASSFIQSILVPISSAIQLARMNGVTSVFKISLAVVRAVGVEIVKDVVTGLAAAGVGYGTNVIVTNLTGNENLANGLGFVSALVTGYFTYKGLTALDAKYNFSGLYSKKNIVVAEGTEKTISRDDSVKQFSDDVWNNMTSDERKLAISRVSDHIADDLGLANKPEIRYYNDPDGGCGFFDDSNYTININEYYFDHYSSSNPIGMEMLDTVAHELRHAMQYLNKASLGDIGWSYDHYISYNRNRGNYYEYRYQPCEADAFSYAETWTDVLKGIM